MVDIISQLNPVPADDPFADWVTFEGNGGHLQSVNTANLKNNARDRDDTFDIFKYLEQMSDEKHEEKHIPDLLDFSKTNTVSKPIAKPSLLPKVNQTIHSPYHLQLNIIGMNLTPPLSNTNAVHHRSEHVITNLTIQSKVCDLKSFLKQRYNLKNHVELVLIYTNFVLLHEYNTLNSYGICNHASILVAFCEDAFRFNSFLLKPKTITSAEPFNSTTQTEQNQLKLLDEFKKLFGFTCEHIKDLDVLSHEIVSNCIKMPCGHGMPCDTLYGYAQSQLHSKKEFVKCPHVNPTDDSTCNKVWYHPVIRYILTQSNRFKAEQIKELEVLSSWNTFKTHYMIAKCPDCECNIFRHCLDDKDRAKAHCPLCVNTFCWKCHGSWMNKASDRDCGNVECTAFEAEYMQILENCALKKVGGVLHVPSIRACPSCSQLITHTEACKHMACPRCKTSFCFVCLKQMVAGKWQCGSSGSRCPIAPNQSQDIETLTKKSESKPIFENHTSIDWAEMEVENLSDVDEDWFIGADD
eukprot:44746_1